MKDAYESPLPQKRIRVEDAEIAYVDAGSSDADPVVFLHGNPTSSFLWRNVIPHLTDRYRCLAPDLVGMGNSEPSPDRSYRFVDHVRYVDAWFDRLGLGENVVLVGHDWGSALAFHWAHRFPDRVRALVYMEALVQARRWADFPAGRDEMFRALRGADGDRLVLEENFFVETVLPKSILRTLSGDERETYRAPFPTPESRLPTLVWPRELPIEGEPADVVEIVEAYEAWLARSDIPKLFINADPGATIVGRARDACRQWPNQTEVTVSGIHFVQEDSPDEIGAAIAEFLGKLGN